MRCYASSVFGVGLGLFSLFNLAVAIVLPETKDSNNSSTHLTFLQQQFALSLVSFALKLTQVLYDEAKTQNVFFSPISMYTTLSTAHLGSSGVTRQELAKVIGFPKDDEKATQMHQIIGELMRSIQVSDRAIVQLANGLFLQKSLPLKAEFNRELKKYYDNEVSIVDFTRGSTATKYINEWISDKTKGHIKNLFQKDLSDSIHIAMVNALYFSTKWGHTFSNESTVVEKFDTGSGQVDVPMMQNKKLLYYLNYQPASFRAIALPLENSEFVMYLALPYANQTLKNMVDFLNVQNLMIALSQSQKAHIDYKIPRMKFQKFLSIKEQLKRIGLENFFEKGEFNGILINSTTGLDVSGVTHGVEIDISEGAISATAESTLILDTYFAEDTQSDVEPIKFHLNRPFMFFINHEQTNTVMFSAVVHNPLE